MVEVTGAVNNRVPYARRVELMTVLNVLPTTLPVVGLGQEVQSRARKTLDHKETLRPSLCSDWPERFVAEWSNRSLNHSGATHGAKVSRRPRGIASPMTGEW